MALASVKNFGRFHSSLFKGTMVDMPLAATEGLLAVPILCEDQRIQHSPVTDAKSGLVVAGKANDPILLPLEGCSAYPRPVFR